MAVRSLLHRAGFRFRVDHRLDLAGGRVRPDVVFRKEKVAVFVDGCFWHGCPDHGSLPKTNRDYWLPKLSATKERDTRADQRLREVGWTVMRVWEHEDPKVVAERIAALVRDRRRVTR